MKIIFISFSIFIASLLTNNSSAQVPKQQQHNANTGSFYGKVLDAKTNKPIAAATVELSTDHYDTATKKTLPLAIKTTLSENNGDFSLENLPVFGDFTLTISAIGYTTYSKKVSFANINASQSTTNESDEDKMSQASNSLDKDLGNIRLEQNETTLKGVVVTASAKPFFEMGVDRKIFNVDKNIVSQGQTATEVMKQIPGVNVDIDGNVTVRNSTPQLFIDGRPTTLTFDQIPSDLIDRVELITNPSAKYDASGGNAGIINIILKKNRKSGYNGGIRTGFDSRGRYNLGGDINFRQNKINFFFNGNYNSRKSNTTFNNLRNNISDTPTTVTQNGSGVNTGTFTFLRTGIDYFIDNRNTLTVSGTYVHGNFKNSQSQKIDSSINESLTSYSNSFNNSTYDFKNYGGRLSYKHNFAKDNNDITADINYNSSTNTSLNNTNTYTYNPGTVDIKQPPLLQQITSTGYNRNLTIQSDYENQINDKSKIEAGARAYIRDYKNINNQYTFSDSLKDYVFIPQISADYKYTDEVYAAYGIYSLKTKNWNYELGLRGESSNYNGALVNTDSAFKVKYPISLFPSAFVTYHLDQKQDLQVNYSRRINRPDFDQLLPFYDYSDPQNPKVGNASLKPEFTNSFELGYNNIYKPGADFLLSAYFKYNTNLITNYQYKAPDESTPDLTDSVIFNTYANANNSITYGLELTNRVTVFKIWDMTANINLYNAKINAANLDQGFNNQRISWFGKLNNIFKIAKGFNFQLSGNYQSKTVLPVSNGGGGHYGGGYLGTAQGYIYPRYGVDMAVQKVFTWKGGNSLSINVNMSDVFRTERYKSFSQSIYFNQVTERRRDPQVVRVNISYRFGKFDASLFKRKNNNENNTDTDIMENDQQ